MLDWISFEPSDGTAASLTAVVDEVFRDPLLKYKYQYNNGKILLF